MSRRHLLVAACCLLAIRGSAQTTDPGLTPAGAGIWVGHDKNIVLSPATASPSFRPQSTDRQRLQIFLGLPPGTTVTTTDMGDGKTRLFTVEGFPEASGWTRPASNTTGDTLYRDPLGHWLESKLKEAQLVDAPPGTSDGRTPKSPSGGHHSRVIGEMFGKEITLRELRHASQRANLANILNTGGSLDGRGLEGRQTIIMLTIRRLQALHEARKLGLDEVSQEELAEHTRTRPIFRNEEGVFDRERAKTIREYLVRWMRISNAGLDRVLRESIAVQRVEERAINGIAVSPNEVHDSYVRSNEAFGISYAQIRIDSKTNGNPLDDGRRVYLDGPLTGIQLSDIRVVLADRPRRQPQRGADEMLPERAKALFKEKVLPHADAVRGMPELNAHAFASEKLQESNAKTGDERRKVFENASTLAKRYLKPGFKPEQRTAWIAQFPTSAFHEEAEQLIGDAQVAEHYEKKPAEYKEREELRASQILVKLSRDADDEAKVKARRRADAILERVRGGESFERIAQNESDDTRTKAKGGDMGSARKGSRHDLDTTLGALEVGEVSGVVETWQGLVIAKLTDRRKGVPFEEAKDKIRRRLVESQAAASAKERAAAFNEALNATFDISVGLLPDNATDSAIYALAKETITEIAGKQGVKLTKIDVPFGAAERPAGIHGGGYELVRSIHSLLPQSPFSGPVDSRGNQSVAMLSGIFPGRIYDLAKEQDVIVSRFSEVARRDDARIAAQARANALRDAYAAAKDGKLPKGEETKLVPFEPFTRTEVAQLKGRDMQARWVARLRFREIPQLAKVMEEIDKTRAKPGMLLDPIEGDKGYVVVRIDSRTLPAEDGFDEAARKQHEYSLRKIKVLTAIGVFYDRLGKEANATLFGESYSDPD
jgi:parvulin-like peptidyl-prolyl isomerase